MEKEKVLRKVILSRRKFSKIKLFEQSTMCFESLALLQKKHLHLLNQMHHLNIALNSNRLTWKIDRTATFWETDCRNADDSFFKNKFRMHRRTFFKLCELLSQMRKNDTMMRDAIPLEKRIAISLYALGTPEKYRAIANMFGVGKSTVCKILLSFCTEVWRVMAPMYLKNFPLTRSKIKELVKEFDTFGFP